MIKTKPSFKILTLFPEIFPGALGCSILGKALEKDLWGLEAINIRDFATDKHQTVDDTCFGGGPGMVMRPDVLDAAIKHAIRNSGNYRILNMSPRGAVFNQSMAKNLSRHDGDIVIISSRYEGIDQRVLDHWNIEDVSLGDFVMLGGEIPAMTVIESTVRLLPGVLGDEASILEESFANDLLEYPQYTRPRNWNGLDVPEVLLNGNHSEINKWRHEMAQKITKTRRPDLWHKYLNKEKSDEFIAKI